MKKFRRFAEVAEVCRFAVVVVEIVFTVVVEVEVEVAAEVFCIVSSRVESNGELQIGYIYIKYIYLLTFNIIQLHAYNQYIVLSCFFHVVSFLLYSNVSKIAWLAEDSTVTSSFIYQS